MSNRNIEDLDVADITEDYLREQAILMGMDLKVDTRQGSIYRDAAEGHIIRAAKFFDDLRQVGNIISISTCTGDVLDEKLHERGLSRNPPEPTPAHYYCRYDGAVPHIGDLCTCDGHDFSVESVGERVVIVSSEAGSDMNNLKSGTPVLPELDIDGLISCTLEEIAEPALDAEDDESARTRLINKVSGPAENGNIAQVQSWCESVEGVGRARIIPLWNGPMTVKAVIISREGKAVTSNIVSDVQDYVDPGISGMGEGMAAIGQFVTCVSAKEKKIDIDVAVIKKPEGTYSEVKEQLENALKAYCKELALGQWSEEMQVRYNKVSAVITEMPIVIDHENLLINGSEGNVAFTVDEVPVPGEVVIHEGI